MRTLILGPHRTHTRRRFRWFYSTDETLRIYQQPVGERTAAAKGGADAARGTNGAEDIGRLGALARGELIGYSTSRTEYPGIIANGIEAPREYGPPSSHGKKIKVSLADDLPVLIGYKNFSYDDLGVDVDLKCTSRMPLVISPDHALQGAIYWRALGSRAQRFCYVTPGDFKVYELEVDVARNALRQAEHIARRIGDLLSRSDDPVEVCRSTVPDFSNFRWSEATRAAAADVWDFVPKLN